MPITHSSRAVNPRDLQVTYSRCSEREALAIAAALTDAGVPCDVHQFPEFQGAWWAVCARRRSQLKRGKALARVYSAGAIDALDMHYGRPLRVVSSEPGQTIDAGDVVIETILHRLG